MSIYYLSGLMPGARLTTVNMTDRMTTFNNVKPSREELEGAARWQEGPRTGKQWHCVWVEAAGEPPPSPRREHAGPYTGQSLGSCLVPHNMKQNLENQEAYKITSTSFFFK